MSGGFKRYHSTGVGWRITSEGVCVEETGLERTPGQPLTVARIYRDFSGELELAASETRVPIALLIATTATESGGRADAVRPEPGFSDEHSTPSRLSSGLMQTLLSTASEMLQMSVGSEALKDPLLSLRAGARYIAHQSEETGLDPVYVAAAYNAGSLKFQGSPNNRWKLRQFPLGTGKHVDRFVRFYNDSIAFLQGAQTPAPSEAVAIPAPRSPGTTASPTVRFTSRARADFVPGYALGVLQELLRRAGCPGALITSTLRTPEDQARIMYDNCAAHGVASQRALYGPPGDAVIQTYVDARAESLSRAEVIVRMTEAIRRLGPSKVSHHVGDPTKLAVLDISPDSLGDVDRFVACARADSRVSKVLVPPPDPAVHLEIPLTKRA